MGGRPPITGRYPLTDEEKAEFPNGFDPEQDHMRGFQIALGRALHNWDYDGVQWATVTFSAQIRKENPGWILSYGATLS